MNLLAAAQELVEIVNVVMEPLVELCDGSVQLHNSGATWEQ